MSVIRRWECERCGAEPEDLTDESHPDPAVTGALCYGRVVAVEYVPASQLRGAVEAIRTLLEHADPGTDDAYLVRASDVKRLRALLPPGGR